MRFNSSTLTEEIISVLIKSCPLLTEIDIESPNLNEPIKHFLTECKFLSKLSITGNNKVSGGLREKTLQLLFDISQAKHLESLTITDQFKISRDFVYRLRRARPHMNVIAGETDGDSMYFMSMMGMSW